MNCLRLTVEWVLRRVVLAHDGITFRDGITVTGLVSTLLRRGGKECGCMLQ